MAVREQVRSDVDAQTRSSVGPPSAAGVGLRLRTGRTLGSRADVDHRRFDVLEAAAGLVELRPKIFELTLGKITRRDGA